MFTISQNLHLLMLRFQNLTFSFTRNSRSFLLGPWVFKFNRNRTYLSIYWENHPLWGGKSLLINGIITLFVAMHKFRSCVFFFPILLVEYASLITRDCKFHFGFVRVVNNYGYICLCENLKGEKHLQGNSSGLVVWLYSLDYNDWNPLLSFLFPDDHEQVT